MHKTELVVSIPFFLVETQKWPPPTVKFSRLLGKFSGCLVPERAMRPVFTVIDSPRFNHPFRVV